MADENPSFNRWEKAQIIASGATSIATVITVLFIYGQLQILRSQLDEMKGSSKQMDAAIKAANTSADAAVKSVEISGLSNRAWLSADVRQSNNLRDNNFKNWSMTVFYKNIGKTPATHLQFYGELELHENPIVSGTRINLLDASLDPPPGNNIVLLPGIETRADSKFKKEDAKDILDRLASGKWLYVVGHVKYRDIDNMEHYTQFCSMYSYQAVIDARNGNQNINGQMCEDFENAN